MAMSEEEFCYWRDERAGYDQLVQEAQKAQAEKQRKARDKK
jgi:hypothetical protein